MKAPGALLFLQGKSYSTLNLGEMERGRWGLNPHLVQEVYGTYYLATTPFATL